MNECIWNTFSFPCGNIYFSFASHDNHVASTPQACSCRTPTSAWRVLKRWRQPRAKRASKSPASSPRVREGGEGGEDRWTCKEEKGDGGRGLRRMALFLVIPRPHSAFQYRGGGGGGGCPGISHPQLKSPPPFRI